MRRKGEKTPQVIKKLRHRFVVTAMSCAFVVLSVVMFFLVSAYVSEATTSANEILDILAEHDGSFPGAERALRHKSIFGGTTYSSEKKFRIRYFVTKVNSNGSVYYISLDNVSLVSDAYAVNLSHAALRSGKRYGMRGSYRYTIAQKDYGTLLVFMDCSEELEMKSFLCFGSFVIVLFMMLVLYLPVRFFSYIATKPVAESFKKQRQFIADAGHEIKTPLAIISANADVLSMYGENSEWVDSIKNQTARLDSLVKKLIALSRMDEQGTRLTFERFDFSKTVEETASAFETLAESKGKSFSLSIQTEVYVKGDQAALGELVSILCDNAIKYSDSEGEIRVSLQKKGKWALLEVYNTCDGIDPKDMDKLFDRFYRADSSRSRQTGGFGIGLSMAKATVLAHKGKITAKSTDGKSVTFSVIF